MGKRGSASDHPDGTEAAFTEPTDQGHKPVERDDAKPNPEARRLLVTASVVLVLVFATIVFAATHRPI
ncbi:MULTISPECIES: hypothetical protein [unclassified Streptomyces]|uniref:hypothetical protein n=1 Tax=unclassified Streptomyces TaxID=2593676 RepID=UPI0029AA654B|nr:hypothetical protein [Streptomyces sp. PA03-2a]MDX2731027.1 hypothetical protein [Streptomyces sp. PA03-2a]